MGNPHHRDLELVRGKESTIWATNLTKELRNDKILVSTYLLGPPNFKEIELKPSPAFFPFFILGSTSPETIMEDREEEEAPRFLYIFLRADEPPLQIILLGAGHPQPPLKMGLFLGAGTHP